MSNIELGYTITTDPKFLDKQNAITPDLVDKLQRFHRLALEGKRSSIKKIQDAIDQYPRNPQLKNYLSVLYSRLNETEKMIETNNWILAEHPDYLFGKLNLAFEYFQAEDYDKIPEILGREMDIKSLYPNRDIFHLNEVVSFLKLAIIYFSAIGNLEQAEIRYDIMHELAPDSEDIKTAINHIFMARMKAGQARLAKEEESKIRVKTKQQEIKTISKVPKFNHEEIEWLYSYGLLIEEKKLNKILSLPKVTLVKDLELVLNDSINRYGYFNRLVEKSEWDEDRMSFVVHAIFLLGELEATESLEVVLNVLSQSQEYLDLYFGDLLVSLIWEPVYKMAANNLESCKQFMFKPGIWTFARTTVADTVEQLALHHSERRDEALKWFSDVLHFFSKSKLEDNVIDSDVIAMLICNVIEIKGTELLPIIEKLFDQRIVSEGICGDLQEVKQSLENPDRYDRKRKILSIIERYNDIMSPPPVLQNDVKSSLQFDYDDYFEPVSMPIRVGPKIGRNEPCPCGSGKKYKKCCLNK